MEFKEKVFKTEEELQTFKNELQAEFLQGLGYENIDDLNTKLNADADAELQAKVDELTAEVEVLKDKTPLTEYKRALSEKLGINVFEDEKVETFLAEIKNNNEALNAANEKLEALQVENTGLKVSFGLMNKNVNAARIEAASNFVALEIQKGATVEDAIDKVVEEFPEWIGARTPGRIGAELDGDNSTLTGRERYYRDEGYTD